MKLTERKLRRMIKEEMDGDSFEEKLRQELNLAMKRLSNARKVCLDYRGTDDKRVLDRWNIRVSIDDAFDILDGIIEAID